MRGALSPVIHEGFTRVADQHPEVMKQIHTIIAREHTPERKYEPAPKESAADYVR